MIGCQSLQLLENVVLGNPQLGVLMQLLEAPDRLDVCPQSAAPPGAGAPQGGDGLMQKAAPSFGRIALMVGFALSCFGLVLFLWLAFGGPVPLKPKGYRVSASFAEASQLATEADVRISGVPVGKVKAIEPDTETGRSIVTIELEAEVRAAAVGRARRCCARRRCSARPTSS